MVRHLVLYKFVQIDILSHLVLVLVVLLVIALDLFVNVQRIDNSAATTDKHVHLVCPDKYQGAFRVLHGCLEH